MPYQDAKALEAHREFGLNGNSAAQALYAEIMAVPDIEYTPKTEEELNQIALDCFKEKLWMRSSMSQEVIFMFMPVAFYRREQLLQLIKIGAYLYEYVDKAGPRSVNGLPIFFSMQILAGSEFDRVMEKLETIKAKL